MIHRLKTLPQYWDAVQRGEKTFEVRRDDRGFQKGDEVHLQRLDPLFPRKLDLEPGTARARDPLKRRIKYILTGGQFGIEAGYVVMALEEL